MANSAQSGMRNFGGCVDPSPPWVEATTRLTRSSGEIGRGSAEVGSSINASHELIKLYGFKDGLAYKETQMQNVKRQKR